MNAKPMRVGIVHNLYRWRGGEDSVFEAEVAQLRGIGVEVRTLVRHNTEIHTLADRVTTALGAIWNFAAYRDVRRFIRDEQISVLHVHNYFPQFSPAVFSAARAEGVPVVFTIHNYRHGCLNAQFFRDGAVCTRCRGQSAKVAGVLLGCYRGSRAGSASVALMLGVHKLLGTWRRDVTVYLALTEFAADSLVAEGIPRDRIVVKPNAVYPMPAEATRDGDFFLFMGRHSPEKGLATLISAWLHPNAPRGRLIVLGEGPLTEELRARASADARIEFRGYLDGAERDRLRRSALAIIVPSEWFEGFPMVIAESLAMGTPIISTRLGAMSSVLRHEVDALLVPPGDAAALAAAASRLADDPALRQRLGDAALARARSEYSAELNAQHLLDLYHRLAGKAERPRVLLAAPLAPTATTGPHA